MPIRNSLFPSRLSMLSIDFILSTRKKNSIGRGLRTFLVADG